ncbi:uncharacterized protein TNCV_3682031 [Trichonephila clavipes]|uniref:GATA zinc finger domain-containing protein 14-like n=1 Tax=Trichonephila clavipes TaxID=2585209 RepID=A0A8X6RLS9_TRICX|nr:uncharacterized protein TNCV_3682031 [Trichonephila clavipes]
MPLMSSFTVIFTFIVLQKNILCFEAFPKRFPKDGLNVLDFETNRLFDPPSRINFQSKDILDYMDKEINKLALNAENVVNHGENFGYKEYTDVSLINLPEKQKVENKTDNVDTIKETEKSLKADLGNFINKSTGNRTEAESNYHVSQLAPKHGYNPQTQDVIIKELGNTNPNNPGYQDKVIYIPVYDQPNLQPQKDYIQQNYESDLNGGTHSNDNKKAIGFIGIVFVHKIQPQDAITPTYVNNNFNQQNNGILHNVQNNRPTYIDVTDGYQYKLSNSITTADIFQQQGGISEYEEETYQPVVQQIEGNRSPQTVTFNSHNEQWQRQKPTNNGWKANPGSTNVLDIPQIQGQPISHQERPWINSQNQNTASFQNAFVNQDINPKGNSKMYNTGRQNFDNKRQIPKNPLFPPRGNAIPKSSSANSNSNKQPNFLNSKNVIQINKQRTNTKNQPNNYQNVKTQHTFKPNSGVYYDDLNKMIAITDEKASGQLIPVIKHVVIEKQVPSINNAQGFISNEGPPNYGRNQQDINQNSQTFHQAPQQLNTQLPSSFANSNVNNGEILDSALNTRNFVQPKWNSNSNNNLSNSPQPQFKNLAHPEQHRRSGGVFVNDKAYESFKSNDENTKENQKQQTFNERSGVPDVDSQHPFFNNLPNLSNNKNPHFSEQTKVFKHGNPVDQEFSTDAEIKEAFRIAGIYIQNQNENLPRQTGNNVHPHNQFETVNPNEAYSHNSKNDRHTPPNLNDVRPTTDQRYNALYHERNHNFNVVKLIDHLLQSHRSSEHPYEMKTNFNKELPKENEWKVVQNPQNTHSSVTETYKDNVNRNPHRSSKPIISTNLLNLNNQRDSLGHINNQHSRHRVTASFQIQDAVTHPQQRNPRNQNLNTNQQHQSEQFYNTSLKQTIPSHTQPSNADYLSEEKGVLVFTGNERKDWKTNPQNKPNDDKTHYQQPGRYQQENHYKENSPNSSEQRPFASVIGRSESNSDPHNKVTKAWYRRDSQNTKDNSAKKNRGKIDNTGVYIANDADGADSNGFGGEKFW